ncbi:MAG: L,D-transpeptidase [Hoeflea sp.]|uniref:L,D-transpeptidase n=1 Tax=Hoeflea sp. TaxID=1940281 RepID=UPI001D9E6DBD|nr:L,D-transpeptidase [Hoeflea sp.]MBU4531722.1 L,D-transpeptidase [Alphaproteobacteria bacterium]MBU4544578.1 L,D-transpeptidase [Alphaproteobacteria bacterium]MBU4552809.1 L,D-transpeptidase [Alphaproteobacteria bacterium]MBV1724998.1 L,D-transpeptidase [Hoeflea sp.]MBV1761018.1 L,D-transpeptidase [Hoeflea sp.]
MTARFSLTIAALAAAFALTACSPSSESGSTTTTIFTSEYGTVKDAGYSIPAVPISKVDKRFHRQIVSYGTKEKPGTIIVDTPNKFLYFVLPGNKAVRYGIGVGKEGFAWEGEAYIAWKQEWPKWTPPREMISRRPDLAKYGDDGMKPGLTNPLGARALYLFNDKGQDTLFRLHGTPEWNSIGTAASSGCIRLMNQDIIDLYSRVRPGKNARVIVKQ